MIVKLSQLIIEEASEEITYTKDGKTHRIKRSSALAYPKDHPAYKAAVKNQGKKEPGKQSSKKVDPGMQTNAEKSLVASNISYHETEQSESAYHRRFSGAAAENLPTFVNVKYTKEQHEKLKNIKKIQKIHQKNVSYQYDNWLNKFSDDEKNKIKKVLGKIVEGEGGFLYTDKNYSNFISSVTKFHKDGLKIFAPAGIHRGILVDQKKSNEILSKFSTGKTVKLDSVSFSLSNTVAKSFATPTIDDGRDSILFHVEEQYINGLSAGVFNKKSDGLLEVFPATNYSFRTSKIKKTKYNLEKGRTINVYDIYLVKT